MKNFTSSIGIGYRMVSDNFDYYLQMEKLCVSLIIRDSPLCWKHNLHNKFLLPCKGLVTKCIH